MNSHTPQPPPAPGPEGHSQSAPGSSRDFDAYGNRIPSDARTMAVLAHLSTLVILLVTAGWLSILGPLVFWLIYKDKPGYAFVRYSSAQAFNFNLLVWIINIAAWILVIVTFGIGIGIVIALPVWAVVNIIAIVCHIIGAVKANRGEVYPYPMKISVLS